MFTGIIQRIGTVSSIEIEGDTGRLIIQINKHFDRKINIGDSISVNGACLTVVEISHNAFVFDVLSETFDKTNFHHLSMNSLVNIECGLAYGDMLGGHIITGHIDGIGIIKSIDQIDRDWKFTFLYPQSLHSLLVKKGSIAIDGVSLTIADLLDDTFTVHIIPHTYNETIFSSYQIEQKVNLETDLLGKYVQRILDNRS